MPKKDQNNCCTPPQNDGPSWYSTAYGCTIEGGVYADDLPIVQSLYCREKYEGITFIEPSMAKQSFAEEADINNIMAQYIKTGNIPVGERQPNYGDFSSETSYQQILDQVQQAQDDFNALDSNVRDQFNNSPSQLINFMADPANEDECIRLGILPQVTLEGSGTSVPVESSRGDSLSNETNTPPSDSPQSEEGN